MSDLQTIPDELKERDQWLFWSAANNTPRAPLESPTANYGCSWSDPETWLSFDDVADRANDVEEAGIGYVNAVDNDDYARGIVGSIDIDGVVDEEGRPKDWLPSLQPFFDNDAYVEYSPSDTGLRIPIVGLDVPEWWTDEHFSAEEHEGVEVLTNKFSTYTGNKLDGAGDQPAEYGDWLDEWLVEAYKAVTGDDPLDDTTVDAAEAPDNSSARRSGQTDEEWVTEEIAEEALTHISPNVTYDVWKDIGMALSNHFGTSRGQSLFEQWSRGGSKWDSEAQKQAERIVNDASSYNYDVATLIHHASNNGWDASQAAKDARQTRPDGGATTASTDTSDTESGPQPNMDWDLQPHHILRLAVDDPLHPLGYDEEGALDGSIRDIRTAERANYVWQLAQKTDRDDILAQHKGPIYAYEDGVWKDDDCERMRQIAGQALDIGFSKAVVGELEEQVRKDRQKRPEQLGAPDGTIMTDNGLLDLLTGDMSEARPGHHALAKIPTEFDEDAECPRWEEFVDSSVDTEAERDKLQEYAGYTLWRHSQDFGKALFLVGPTDSGKGTALKAIKQVLGRENVAAESLNDLIQTRWGTAQLYGNIANMRNEVTPSGLSQVQKFKELTGGEDEVSAEFKGKEKFQMVVTQKFLFSTNEVPTIANADEAFYNRLLFVRFPNTVAPEDQDKQLLDKLSEERSGILNWMLAGLRRLLKQGYFSGERTTNGKKEICDAFGGVLDRFSYNCLMITGNEDDVVAKSDLHDLAHAYADDIDKEPEWGKQTGFSREMANQRGIGQGQRRIGGDNSKVFTGVRVKPEVVYRFGMDIRAKTAESDESRPTGLRDYQDTDVRPGYDSETERDIPPLVLQLVREKSGDMTRGELVRTLKEKEISDKRIQHGIKKALKRGDISEPSEDQFRA